MRDMIYVSTACLGGVERLGDRISRYRAHGLDAVELGAGVSVVGEELSSIGETGCRFLVHNYFPPPPDPFVINLASRDDRLRCRSLTLVSEAITLAAHLHAPSYSLHAGFITDPKCSGGTQFVFPAPVSSADGDRAMVRFISALGLALEAARRVNVRLLVENNVCTPELRGKLLLQTADEFAALFRALPDSHLGILLDTGHLNVTARTFGFEPEAFIAGVGPHIKGFHVHDNDGLVDAHRPLGPGGWVLGMLGRPEFADLPIVVESKFDSIDQLCRHTKWLQAELCSRQ
jgi:sugar phosphate isomerase/epimerase